MRSQVYRNLDKPFQILGFYLNELVILCFTLVVGSELTQLFEVQNAWSFLSTLILAFALFWFRRSLGEKFGQRIIRFINLPSHTIPKLIKLRGLQK